MHQKSDISVEMCQNHKNAAVTPERAWTLALEKVRSLEKVWDTPVSRARELIAFRYWLEAMDYVPYLAKLAPMLTDSMTRRDLECVIVPIERAAAKRRVTDALILSSDLPTGAKPAASMPLTVIADSLRSAFNIGSVFRSAECFGVARIWLCGYSAEPSHPQVAEAALGTEMLVPWRTFEHTVDAIRSLKTDGVRVIALETAEHAETLDSYEWKFPCAIVLGNERFGLAPEIISLCDDCLRITMYGRKNSLNVATAAAVVFNSARTAFNVRNSL